MDTIEQIRARLKTNYGPPPYTYQKAFVLALDDLRTLLTAYDAQTAELTRLREWADAARHYFPAYDGEGDYPISPGPNASATLPAIISGVTEGQPSGMLRDDTAAELDALTEVLCDDAPDDPAAVHKRAVQLRAIEAAAGAVDACITDQRVDQWGHRHIYVRLGDTEYGLDESEPGFPLLMAMLKLHDALKAPVAGG